MTKVYILLFVLSVLLGCNTAKHLEKQQKAIESLTNKVNASKVLQIKDSVVFKAGQVQTVRDTTVIIDSADGKTIERYYFNTETKRRDSVTYFQRDAIRENALFSENEKNKGLLAGKIETVLDLKKTIRTIIIVFGIVFLLALLLTKLKFL